MIRQLTIDDTPLVLATTDVPAINNNSPLGANNGERQKFLSQISLGRITHLCNAYLNGLFRGHFLVVVLLIVVRVHAQVVELELLLYPVLELSTLFQGQAVALRDNRDDIHKLAKFLENNNVDGLQSVTRWLDEEQAAVDASVLKVPLTLGSELLAEVGAVLVLDVLDNGIPAALVVDQVTITGRVDNVKAQTHAILLDDV